MNRYSSITCKILIFIIAMAALSLANITLIYTKQIKDAEIRYEESISVLVDYLRVPVEDFVITGNITNLDRLASKTISSNVIAAIVVNSPAGKQLASFPGKVDYALPVKEIPIFQSLSQNAIGIAELSQSSSEIKLVGNLVVYLDNTDKLRAIRALKRDLAISCIVTLFILGIAFLLVRKYFIRPLRQVFNGASAILESRYDSVQLIDQKDELGLLSSYLTRIAQNFSTRDKLQREQLREIIQSNANITVLQKEKDTLMDRLLDGVTPSLQEAMSTIKFLSDKPAIQANLTKSILFALSLTEETKSLLTTHSSRLFFAPETMPFNDFFNLVHEYLNFFSEKIQVPISLNMSRPDNLETSFIITDKRETMRLFAHIFELINYRSSSSADNVQKLRVIFEQDNEGRVSADLIIRSTNYHLSDRLCASINKLFASASSEESVADLKASIGLSPDFSIHIFTYLGLKKLMDILQAQYTVIRSSNQDVIHSFSFPLVTSTDPSFLEGIIANCLAARKQKLCAIGSPYFIKQLTQKHYGHSDHIEFVSYETATSMPFSTVTHYIIDLIHDRDKGLAIAKKILDLGSTTHNVAAVVRSSDTRDNSLFTWCDLDFDMFIYDTVSVGDLQKIQSRKHVSDRAKALSTIMNSIKAGGTEKR